MCLHILVGVDPLDPLEEPTANACLLWFNHFHLLGLAPNKNTWKTQLNSAPLCGIVRPAKKWKSNLKLPNKDSLLETPLVRRWFLL